MDNVAIKREWWSMKLLILIMVECPFHIHLSPRTLKMDPAIGEKDDVPAHTRRSQTFVQHGGVSRILDSRTEAMVTTSGTCCV